jgi:hypothetical protein
MGPGRSSRHGQPDHPGRAKLLRAGKRGRQRLSVLDADLLRRINQRPACRSASAPRGQQPGLRLPDRRRTASRGGVRRRHDLDFLPRSNTTHIDALSHIYFQGKIYNATRNSYGDRGGKNDVMAFKDGVFTPRRSLRHPEAEGRPHRRDEPICVEDLEAWEKRRLTRGGDEMLVRTGRWVRVRTKVRSTNQLKPGLTF